jgi:molybdenum cofactor cytidylyltransferase
MRRGHPWLVARALWSEIFELQPPASPRDFLNKHAGEIHYINIDSESILADLDTPEDYQKAHP